MLEDTSKVSLVIFVALVLALIVVSYKKIQADNQRIHAASTAASASLVTEPEKGADAAYLASKLTPTSTPLDILLIIATCPENVNLSQQSLDKVEELKQARRRMASKKTTTLLESGGNATRSLSLEDMIGDDGWADEDDDDDEETKAAVLKAKLMEEEQKKAREQLQEAQGNKTILLEELDEGVIGQCWVENTLEKAGHWPPSHLGCLEGDTYYMDKNNKAVSAMDHPAIRRNLCMTIGRLNAGLLNGHVELLEAGSKGLVDQTYFKSTMEYRQRAAILLEAALRIAVTLQSYRLAKTIIETVSMFKIGTKSCDKEAIEWFNDVMKRQYGDEGIPKLALSNVLLETPGEAEIATGDVCAVQFELERCHAENFTKQKIAMCQKQGIPPQIALQTYREGWWVMIRAKKLSDGQSQPSVDESKVEQDSPIAPILTEAVLQKFANEKEEDRLLTAWPMIVQNVAQQSGKVKIQFKAPEIPGKYCFFIDVKSQEFLGADQELTIEAEVLDRASVKRVEKKEEVDEDEESKKEK